MNKTVVMIAAARSTLRSWWRHEESSMKSRIASVWLISLCLLPIATIGAGARHCKRDSNPEVRIGCESVLYSDLSRARKELQELPAFEELINSVNDRRSKTYSFDIPKVKICDVGFGDRRSRKYSSDSVVMRMYDYRELLLITNNIPFARLNPGENKLELQHDCIPSSSGSGNKRYWEHGRRDFHATSFTVENDIYPFQYTSNWISEFRKNKGCNSSCSNDFLITRSTEVSVSDFSESVFVIEFSQRVRCVELDIMKLTKKLNESLSFMSAKGLGSFAAFTLPADILTNSICAKVSNEHFDVVFKSRPCEAVGEDRNFKNYEFAYIVTSKDYHVVAEQERFEFMSILESVQVPRKTDAELVAKCRQYEFRRKEFDEQWDDYQKTWGFHIPVSDRHTELEKICNFNFAGFEFGTTNMLPNTYVNPSLRRGAYKGKSPDSAFEYLSIAGGNRLVDGWGNRYRAYYTIQSKRLYKICLFGYTNDIAIIIRHLSKANGKELMSLDERLFADKMHFARAKSAKDLIIDSPLSTQVPVMESHFWDNAFDKTCHSKSRNGINITFSSYHHNVEVVIVSADLEQLAKVESDMLRVGASASKMESPPTIENSDTIVACATGENPFQVILGSEFVFSEDLARARKELQESPTVPDSDKMSVPTDMELIEKCRQYEKYRREFDDHWESYQAVWGWHKPGSKNYNELSRFDNISFGDIEFGTTNMLPNMIENPTFRKCVSGVPCERDDFRYTYLIVNGGGPLFDRWVKSYRAHYTVQSKRLFALTLYGPMDGIQSLIDHMSEVNGQDLLALDKRLLVRMKNQRSYESVKAKIRKSPTIKPISVRDACFGSDGRFSSCYTKSQNRINIAFRPYSKGIAVTLTSPDFEQLAELEHIMSLHQTR